MGIYRIVGTTTINIYATVEAESEAEAIGIAERDICLEEYCDGTIGAYSTDCDDVELSENGWIDFDIDEVIEAGEEDESEDEDDEQNI